MLASLPSPAYSLSHEGEYCDNVLRPGDISPCCAVDKGGGRTRFSPWWSWKESHVVRLHRSSACH